MSLFKAIETEQKSIQKRSYTLSWNLGYLQLDEVQIECCKVKRGMGIWGIDNFARWELFIDVVGKN